MGEIPFTQYFMPDGHQKPMSVKVEDAVSAFAQSLIAKGYRFECEMLSDYQTISLTVVNPEDTQDIAIVLCQNGPEVIPSVSKLVKDAVEYDLGLVGAP
jgi:hypothetical protein